MTEEIVDSSQDSAVLHTGHLAKRSRSPMFWLAAVVIAAICAVVLGSDIYPIITNDSLGYLDHSRSFGEMGLVQVGYRQIGYPIFLATVDWVATAFRMEPLILTALLQRLLVLSALGFAGWLWRWRALPLVAFVVLPTLLSYSNFVLNEGLGIGLILWYAVLVAWVIRLGPAAGTDLMANDRTIMITGVLVAFIYLALVTFRSYFTLLGFGLVAVLWVVYKTGRRGRSIAVTLLVLVSLAGSGYLALTSMENQREYGVFLPAVRGERAQFHMTWQETFNLTPETRTNEQLTDLYADGNPYAVMAVIDALPTYADQQERYSEVINRMFEQRDTSWNEERFRSALGVFRGGQFDDVHGIVVAAAESSFDTVEALIYRNVIARREGNGYIDDVFNEGRRIQPVMTSALAPLRTFPYFSSISRWLLPAAVLIMVLGAVFKPTRWLSAVGLATIVSFAAILGLFLQDSVRVVLIPLLFSIAIASGVLDTGWRSLMNDRARWQHGGQDRPSPLTPPPPIGELGGGFERKSKP